MVTMYFKYPYSVDIVWVDSFWRPGPKVIKLFSYSTQLSTKFILLINVKMPTIVGILTFISMINTTSERLKARNFVICRYSSFSEQLKFRAQLSWARKTFYNLGAWFWAILTNDMRGSRKFCQRGSNSDNFFFLFLWGQRGSYQS